VTSLRRPHPGRLRPPDGGVLKRERWRRAALTCEPSDKFTRLPDEFGRSRLREERKKDGGIEPLLGLQPSAPVGASGGLPRVDAGGRRRTVDRSKLRVPHRASVLHLCE
jgi:hypothetical protein